MDCPKCKTRKLIDRERFVACEANKRDGTGCNFILWRNVLQKLGLEKLSDEQIATLASGQRVHLELVSAKTSKKFECDGELVEENDKWKIHFHFPETAPAPAKVFGEAPAAAQAAAEEKVETKGEAAAGEEMPWGDEEF